MGNRQERESELKYQGVTIELYNLIKNENGFEESIGSGTKHELETLKSEIEFKNKPMQDSDTKRQVWGGVSYYIVPKREWDVEHCPLIPVDYS
jgi:hypothetical protein